MMEYEAKNKLRRQKLNFTDYDGAKSSRRVRPLD